mgnify:FL=1
MDTAATREFLRAQMANRPESRLQDLCKALYQSTFGCGHLISDVTAAEQSIREELADVLSYCVLMADVCGLDLDEILNAKVDQNAAKYPVEKARGSAAKYTELT